MTKKASCTKRRLISDIGPNDVLLGRGAGPNEHVGNITFRQIVADHKKAYMTTTNRKIKNQIAKQAIQVVKADNGRFLQKVKDKDGDIYMLADETVVLEKTKQALRHLERPKKASLGSHPQMGFFAHNDHLGKSSSLLRNELNFIAQLQQMPQTIPRALSPQSNKPCTSLMSRYADAVGSHSSTTSRPSSLASVLEQQLALVSSTTTTSNAQSRHNDIVTLLAINSLCQRQSTPPPTTLGALENNHLCSLLSPPVCASMVLEDSKAMVAAERLRSAIALLRCSI
jgi:hypothetical protein